MQSSTGMSTAVVGLKFPYTASFHETVTAVSGTSWEKNPPEPLFFHGIVAVRQRVYIALYKQFAAFNAEFVDMQVFSAYCQNAHVRKDNDGALVKAVYVFHAGHVKPATVLKYDVMKFGARFTSSAII